VLSSINQLSEENRIIRYNTVGESIKAYKIIGSPEKWTQVAMAVTKDGVPCHPADGRAVAYSDFGAVRKAYGTNWVVEFELLGSRLRRDGFSVPLDWNCAPERTWRQVYEILKELDL
jgi:hypothetical protein